MKRLSFALVVFACVSAAFGATRPSATTPARSTRPTVAAAHPSGDTSTNTTSRTVTSRSATTAPTTQVARGRAATTPTTTNARAAKQSVISTGTKVVTAAENTAVDPVCWGKFSGCMDSFCMLDNASGGRCICSDKNAEYDAILEEIQKLDEQSYQLATVGVERIEMGDAVDAVMSKTDSVTKRVTADAAKSKRQSLDLSSWNSLDLDFDADAEDIFDFSSDSVSISNKTGDALYRAAAKLCNAQIPECKSQSTLMGLMYKQRIRSDCTAYENSLRQARTQSAQKLAAAQSAMREAALEQYRNANKYDLGQCTVQFKQCMQTTGGCGDDFTGCVEWSVRENMVGNSNKEKTIKGTVSKIKLRAETYDTLEAKKELCMTVTEQCVNVRDQVWDAFLREAAPQIKSAELIVESNMRTSCISNISNCFQKACKETMDPNNPDGSYDMCLTRPETVDSACKVEVEPCEKAIPDIMTYVHARLASMRVDSCTNEFKACLQSEDRCGEDYTQCIGLDTDTIVEMCPADKLVACQYDPSLNKGNTGTYNADYVYKKQDVYNNLKEIATGIFLNIDNNMLTACQKAVRNKVIEVCGSLTECEAFEDDTIIGTDSLYKYKNSAGDTVIDGLMNFGLLEPNSDGTDVNKTNYSDLFDGNNLRTGLSQTKKRIASSINAVANKIKQKIDIIKIDPTIYTCINGRNDTWRGGTGSIPDYSDRFPHLLDSYNLMIFNSGLDKAYLNYMTTYDEMLASALEDQNDDVKSTLCAAISYNEGSAYCTEYEATEDGEPICKEFGAHGALEDIFNTVVTADNTGGSMSGVGASVRGGSVSDLDTMGLSSDGLSYVIKGANVAKKLQNMSKGKGEYIQVDDEGNMIGSIIMTSIYSSDTNTCHITTESRLCKNIEVATTPLEVRNVRKGARIELPDGTVLDGGGMEGSKIKKLKTEIYEGTYCSEYQEPVITTEDIRM